MRHGPPAGEQWKRRTDGEVCARPPFCNKTAKGWGTLIRGISSVGHPAGALKARKYGQDLADGVDHSCGGVDVFGDGGDAVLDLLEGVVGGFDLGRELDEKRGVDGELLLVRSEER